MGIGRAAFEWPSSLLQPASPAPQRCPCKRTCRTQSFSLLREQPRSAPRPRGTSNSLDIAGKERAFGRWMASAKGDAQRLWQIQEYSPSPFDVSPRMGLLVLELWLCGFGPSLTSPQFVPKSGRGLISVPRTRCPTRNKRSPPPLHSSRWAPRLFHCYRRSCGERGRGAWGVPRVLESLKVSWDSDGSARRGLEDSIESPSVFSNGTARGSA